MAEKSKKAASKKSSSDGKAADKATSKAISKSTRFEDALGELETIVQQLETGEQPLDKSLEQFERGIALARFCQSSLSEADRKVKILLEENNGESLQDFDQPL